MTKFLAFILGSVVTTVLSLVLFRWVRRVPVEVFDEAAMAATRAAVAADMTELLKVAAAIEADARKPKAPVEVSSEDGTAAAFDAQLADTDGEETPLRQVVTAQASSASQPTARVLRRQAVGHGRAIGEARTWARANGFQVGDRGPLSESIWRAYQDAHVAV